MNILWKGKFMQIYSIRLKQLAILILLCPVVTLAGRVEEVAELRQQRDQALDNAIPSTEDLNNYSESERDLDIKKRFKAKVLEKRMKVRLNKIVQNRQVRSCAQLKT